MRKFSTQPSSEFIFQLLIMNQKKGKQLCCSSLKPLLISKRRWIMRAAESCPLPFRYIVPLVLTDFLHLFPHICASDLVYPQRQVTIFKNWTAWNVYHLKLSFKQNFWKPRKNAAQVGLLVFVRSVRLPVLPWKKTMFLRYIGIVD